MRKMRLWAITLVPFLIALGLLASFPGGRPTAALKVTTALTPANDPVIVGAGDISSCDNGDDEATAALLDSVPGTVFTAGDNVYDAGTAQEFASCFDPTWGRHKARTRPAVGNHEYGIRPMAAGCLRHGRSA